LNTVDAAAATTVALMNFLLFIGGIMTFSFVTFCSLPTFYFLLSSQNS
jgi:hypothetical protein